MSATIRRFAFIFVLISMVSASAAAYGKTQEGYTVDYDRLWSTVLRLIRVDLAHDVTDKDKDAGYVIFTYKLTSGKSCRASLEIVPEGTAPREKATRFIVHVDISSASSVEERMILGALNKKLRAEGAI